MYFIPSQWGEIAGNDNFARPKCNLPNTRPQRADGIQTCHIYCGKGIARLLRTPHEKYVTSKIDPYRLILFAGLLPAYTAIFTYTAIKLCIWIWSKL